MPLDRARRCMASATVSNQSPMALTFVKHRDASFLPRSHQQIENAEAALPVLGLRILQVAVDYLEGACECHAQPARDLGQAAFGVVAISKVQRRPRSEMVEYRLQFDLLVDLPEFVDAFLQTLGDRQIERLDDDPAICLGRGPAPKQ